MIQLLPVTGIPDVHPGDNLATLIVQALQANAQSLLPKDLLVVAQKIVSKAEDRLVRLADVTPSDFALQVARQLAGRDPRLVEIILRESRRIVRMDRGVLIAETHHGFICANAGVDLSNVDGGITASLLPLDPDASAARISNELTTLAGVAVPVIVSDTFGRPWREGLVDVAIGVHGLLALRDCRRQEDAYGYPLNATILAEADQLAASAGLVFRKNGRVPVCLIRGFDFEPSTGSARLLLRDPGRDLFR